MAGPLEGGGSEGTDDREVTPPPLTKEQIEGHVSALKSLIKDHNQRNKTYPIHLDFELEDTKVRDQRIVKGKEVEDEDVKKPFKEARKTPITSRIIEFAGPKYKMPANFKLHDGTPDPEDHLCPRGWFERLPHDNIKEWADLKEAFAARYSIRRAYFKEPHEITKIVIKANELLTAFKERCTVETGFIMGIPEVMKISSFMDAVKLPELAKHFSNKVPVMVNEMMERMDDFVRSEEAYANTELPKGTLYKRLYPTEKIVGNGTRIKKAESPSKRLKDKKWKGWEVTKAWMNTLITFPSISSEDIFDEPLIVEAEVEGYLVKRVYVDEGSSVEVVFDHCFKNLDSRIKAKLKETQTDLVGFAGEISKPLGKIEMAVRFGNGGL
ncbi:hypothetical protein Tco_0646496 [Tanacetum coccineum]